MPTIPDGVDTLILVDTERIQRMYGGTAAADVLVALHRFSNPSAADQTVVEALGMTAVVDPARCVVERPGRVRRARRSPMHAERSNDVVRSVNDLVDELVPPTSAARAGLENVVLIGDDTQIPHARLVDGTLQGNERGFAGEMLLRQGEDNQLSAAAAVGTSSPIRRTPR